MERYYNDEPFSYGGKYRLFDYLIRVMLMILFQRVIYIHVLNNIENRKSIHRFMYIVDVNYSNLMLYFLQIGIW